MIKGYSISCTGYCFEMCNGKKPKILLSMISSSVCTALYTGNL